MSFRVYDDIKIYKSRNRQSHIIKRKEIAMNYSIYERAVISVKRRENSLDFYITDGKRSSFLMTADYSPSVMNFYRKGVVFDKALDRTLAKRNHKINKVMDRLRYAIKYLNSSGYADNACTVCDITPQSALCA